MTTKFIRFTEKARAEPQLRFNALMGLLFDPEGLHASFERQNGRQAPGVDGIRKVDYDASSTTSTLCRWGGLKLGAGWCNAPCPVLRGAGDVPLCGHDIVAPPGNQAATEKTNCVLARREKPAYSPNPLATFHGSRGRVTASGEPVATRMGEREHYATDVSDGQWELIEPLLPAPKKRSGGPGRPPCDRRQVLDGIFYVNRTGCQWRYLPKSFGHWNTVYTYFDRWSKAGTCVKVPPILLALSSVFGVAVSVR